MSQGVECYSCLPKTAWPSDLERCQGNLEANRVHEVEAGSVGKVIQDARRRPSGRRRVVGEASRATGDVEPAIGVKVSCAGQPAGGAGATVSTRRRNRATGKAAEKGIARQSASSDGR